MTKYRLVGDDWVPIERVPPAPERQRPIVKNYEHVSHSLPRLESKEQAARMGVHVNDKLQPVFRHRRDIENYSAFSEGRFTYDRHGS